MPADKERVAILGGGIGALTAAWELQKTGNYDITVYQMGWRLGGKCATGRDPSNGYRLEEHGIHGFLGSYYNALEMMAEVFEVLDALPDKQGLLTRFDDAFDLQNAVAMWDFNRATWEHWSLELPINEYRYCQRLQNYRTRRGDRHGEVGADPTKHSPCSDLRLEPGKNFVGFQCIVQFAGRVAVNGLGTRQSATVKAH